jgi:hypothetical protein
VFSHAQLTIPRHLRDLIVTEYGIADLRGKPDADCIMAMLAIADSRFQGGLAEAAKRAGKLPKDFSVPEAWRRNTPENLRGRLDKFVHGDALPVFPFGTDFDAVEQRLLPALGLLKRVAHSKARLMRLVLSGMRGAALNEQDRQCLARMKLDMPSGITERLSAYALRGALLETRGD